MVGGQETYIGDEVDGLVGRVWGVRFVSGFVPDEVSEGEGCIGK